MSQPTTVGTVALPKNPICPSVVSVTIESQVHNNESITSVEHEIASREVTKLEIGSN